MALSVVTEAMASVCVSIPLLFMTNALGGSFSWEIFLAVLLVGYLFTPIGAIMLKVFDPRRIELILALFLIVVLLILLEAHVFLINLVRGRSQRPVAAAPDAQESEEKERLVGSTPTKAEEVQEPASEAQAEDKTWYQRLSGLISGVKEWCVHTSTSLSSSEGRRDLLVKWKSSLWLLMWASLAGSCSGLMNGMTGMGGPPLILLYSFLEIQKGIVRGTNAWLNVFSFIRVIIYITLGLIVVDLWDVYVTGIAFHIPGVALGNSLSYRIDQKLFVKILLGLVSI